MIGKEGKGFAKELALDQLSELLERVCVCIYVLIWQIELLRVRKWGFQIRKLTQV